MTLYGLLAAPIIKKIRELNTSATILVSTMIAEVFNNSTDVNGVIPYSNGRFDGAFLVDLDGSYESNRSVHMVDAYKATAGLTGDMPDPEIKVTQELADRCRDNLRARGYNHNKSICMHMAGSAYGRVWNVGRWRELIHKIISNTDYGIIAVGADADYGNGICENKYVSMVGGSSILESAAYMKLSDMFIGVDSGMSHVAFATQTRSVILYGMAHQNVRAPRHTRCIGVSANPGSLKCLFCMATDNKVDMCGITYETPCMNLIQVNDVYNAVKTLAAEINI